MERKKVKFEELPGYLKKEYPDDKDWLAFFKMWLDSKGYDYGTHDKHIVDGCGDGGIDAIGYPPDDRRDLPIVIIQSKYYKGNVSNKALKSFFLAVKAFKTSSSKDFEAWLDNVKRKNLSNVYREIWQRKRKIEFVIVTSGELEIDVKMQARKLDVKIEDKGRISSIFQDMVQGKAPRPEEIKLTSFSKLIPVLKNESHNMFVMSARLKDFAQAYQVERKDLFAGNVRYALSGKSEVQKGISKTLKNNPEEFMLFHNGITIVCKKATISGKKVTLTSPSIVNGAQTVSYLGQSLYGKISSDASVLVKIVEVKNDNGFEEFETDIAMSSNTQNSVSYSDLSVIDPDLVSLEKYFRSERCFLERKRGTISIRNPELKITKDRLLQLFVSVEPSLGPSVTKDKQALYKNNHSGELFEYYSLTINRKREALFLARLDKFVRVSLGKFKNSEKNVRRKKRRLSLSYFTIFTLVELLIRKAKKWDEIRLSFSEDGIFDSKYSRSLEKDVANIARLVLSQSRNDIDKNETAFFKNRIKVTNSIQKVQKQYWRKLQISKV